MDRTNELEEQVEKLTGDIEEMRARMARLESGESGHKNGSEPKSRRNFLRFGAGAILGALGVAATKVLPASATNGVAIVAGQNNTAGATTSLTGDTSSTTTGPNPVLKVQALAFNQTPLTGALGSNTFQGPIQALGGDAGTGFDGLDAFASGPSSAAVWGLTDAGYGVIGESNTGIGLYARRSGRIRQEGAQIPGAPTFDGNIYEQVRDATGVLWLNSAAAGHAPAIWRRVNTVRFDKADGTGGSFKPFRLIDTRLAGGPRGSATFNDVVVIPQATLPPDTIGIVGNLTAVNYNNVGFLTIMPKGVAYDPSTDPSSVNLISGSGAVANAFICGIGTSGSVTVFIGSPGSSHFIIDITGYIQ